MHKISECIECAKLFAYRIEPGKKFQWGEFRAVNKSDKVFYVLVDE